MANEELKRDLKKLERKLLKSIKKHKIPWIGLRCVNMRLKGRHILLKGIVVPNKHKGVIEDFNINYSPKAKSTLHLYVLDTKFNIMPYPILKNITSSTNGCGKVILEEGCCLALLLEKPDGRTKFSCYMSGFIK